MITDCGAPNVHMVLALDPPRLELSVGGERARLTLLEATRAARAWARLVELGWREVEAAKDG